MAGPIALAAALAQSVTIACPHCGKRKLVPRASAPRAYRVCPRCKRHFPDPLAQKRSRR